MTRLSTIHGLSGVAYNWYRRSRNSLVSYAVDGVAKHASLNPAIPRISVRTPSARPRVCIFIGIFYVESTCHFTDVSFSATIQYGACACVAGFHVWLLVRIRLYRFPRPIRTTNFLTFCLAELHEYLCETPVAIILTGMNLIWVLRV